MLAAICSISQMGRTLLYHTLRNSGILSIMIGLLLLLLLAEANSQGSPFTDIINTEYGPVRGLRRNLDDNAGTVNIYHGIPFAAPPIQERRFRHPEPPTPWQDVYNATELPNICPQIFPLYPIDEDCLYLSVYVPETETENKAVMVWIHGGGFELGDINMYDGSYLAAFNDVIVVNIAYRLRALGFMSLDIDNMPGNAGIMDQVFGLQWVQRNVANFGGDPGKVTIFGESAGAGSVGLHLVSPLSQDLYSRAIMQSGGPNNHWLTVSREVNLQSSVQLSENLGCHGDDASIVLECLLQLPAEDFIQSDLATPFGAIEDGHILVESPGDSMQNGNFNNVPIMLGTNKNEGTMFLYIYLPDYFSTASPTINSSQFIDSMERLFAIYPDPDGTSPAGIDAAMFEYTNWEDVEDSDANIAQLDHVLGDRDFVCGVQRTADLYAEADQKVYFFRFTQRFENHIYPEWTGVAHGDEVLAVFGNPFFPSPIFSFTAEETQLSFEMMKHWTNFAKTGDPNVDDDGEVMASEWPLYTKDIRQYKDLNAEWMYEPESIKSGSLRPHQCAFFEHYLPQVEDGCPVKR